MTDWLSNFESIGENCEFGFVQRALGVEESSLLRWVMLDSVDATVNGITNDFRGIYKFENLEPAGAGTMVRDVTAGIAFHTAMKSVERDGRWVFIATEDERRAIHEQEILKIDYLRGKFLRAMNGHGQIYVAKRNDGLHRTDAQRLSDAIAVKGGGRLLYVTQTDDARKIGTVEPVNDRIAHGWIDCFAPFDRADHVSLVAWELVLRGAEAAFVPHRRHTAAPRRAGVMSRIRARALSITGSQRHAAVSVVADPLPAVSEPVAPRDNALPLLFDAKVYMDRYTAAGGVFGPGVPPSWTHWLEHGRSLRIVPTTLFDEGYYAATYPDIAQDRVFGFWHYLEHGMAERRAPTFWFDPDWYVAQGGNDQAQHYGRFVSQAADAGRAPGALAQQICARFAPHVAYTLQIYQAMVDASARWSGRVTKESIEVLATLFTPRWHAGSSDALRCFLDYLSMGFVDGITPGPLFDNAVYLQRAQAAGLAAPDPGESPVMHWLAHGRAARIVPTERFDDDYYRATHLDMAHTADWGFTHFIRYGVGEGRPPRFERNFRLAEPMHLQSSESRIRDLYDRWYAGDFPESPSLGEGRISAAANKRLQDVLTSTALQEIYREAQELEPLVGEISSITEFLLLPYYDPLWIVHGQARRRLPRTQYDTVICVPWMRTGGADLVAGLLAKSLLRIRSDEHVLVLRTDNPHFERGDWMPGQADVVDISDLAAGVAAPLAQLMLRVMLRGVGARRVFNVNSLLCWNVMQMHGVNLAATLNTYAYLFCWDQTATGLRVGYPSMFFAETAGSMTAFLTDTSYLRNELIRMYRLPGRTQDRIVALFTPSQTKVRLHSVARKTIERADPASRRRVFWAGRLDRQKRFDLVQEIARRMPDVEFRCWGSALIDAPPDLSALPGNVTMRGGFDSFDDLPLDEAGAWLFTTGWEGMPTTIIELAMRGVVIVASAVGGVPELIRPETGWPVAANGQAADYVAILYDALDRPEEAMRRAEALQRQAGTVYTEARYDAALEALLAKETLQCDLTSTSLLS